MIAPVPSQVRTFIVCPRLPTKTNNALLPRLCSHRLTHQAPESLAAHPDVDWLERHADRKSLTDHGAPLSSERQVENRKRELCIVFRLPLCILTEQAKLEPLDLLLEQPGELLALVALMLELFDARFKTSIECLESLFEGRRGHSDHEFKI